MIIKSMSRKEPSFDQLASYMSSEKSDGDYDLYHNCFSRSHGDIVEEFLQNSKRLAKRKNGNYLYHEIVSILIKEGIDQEQAKQDLRNIAEQYIQARCSRNMVYGCLHEDHDHNLHYHLMISANERGNTKRMRLNKKQFDTAKRNLEDQVLEQFPHLEQPKIINTTSVSEKMSFSASEVNRRRGAMPIRDEIKQTITNAMKQNQSMNDFVFHLSEQGYRFYTRGKNFGVEVQLESGKTKKYRFSTLGIHDTFLDIQNDLVANAGQKQHSKDLSEAEQQNATSTAQEKTKAAAKQNKTHKETLERSAKNDQTSNIKKTQSDKDILREKLKQVRNQKIDEQDDSNEDGNNL